VPISGLVCKQCGKVVGASGLHWVWECPSPAIHPGLVQAALNAESHLGWELTPTTVLGSIRAEIIKRLLPYKPDARGFNSAMWGAAVGRMVEEGMVTGGWLRQVALEGEFWGHPFLGHADLVLADPGSGLWLIDNKAKGEWSFFLQKGRGELASAEDSAQLSMYARMRPKEEALRDVWEAARQKAVHLIAWYGSMLAAERKGEELDPWIKARAPLMTMEEIGGLHSGGAANTVREAVDIFVEARRRKEAGDSPETILAAVPMHCQSRFNGKVCRLYCGANRVCLGLAGISLASKGIVAIRDVEAEKL